jgi:hypothetical protein
MKQFHGYPVRERDLDRNTRIRAAYARMGGNKGDLKTLSEEFSLSRARICQIVRGRSRDPNERPENERI